MFLVWPLLHDIVITARVIRFQVILTCHTLSLTVHSAIARGSNTADDSCCWHPSLWARAGQRQNRACHDGHAAAVDNILPPDRHNWMQTNNFGYKYFVSNDLIILIIQVVEPSFERLASLPSNVNINGLRPSRTGAWGADMS